MYDVITGRHYTKHGMWYGSNNINGQSFLSLEDSHKSLSRLDVLIQDQKKQGVSLRRIRFVGLTEKQGQTIYEQFQVNFESRIG